MCKALQILGLGLSHPVYDTFDTGAKANTYLELKKLTTLKEQRAQTSKQKNSRACSLYTEDKARGSRAKQKPFRQQHSFSQTPRTVAPPQPHQQRWTEHLDFQPQPQYCGVWKAEQGSKTAVLSSLPGEEEASAQQSHWGA